jgi:tetratricopeptide (TPR) repeat protein
MMAHKRFLLLWIALLILGQTASASNQRSGQYRAAKRHFERAMELDSFNDPRAEQEYRLAIKVRGGAYPDALQQLSFYLQRRLRFSEAAKALEEYISQTPQADHANDLKDLNDLQRAISLQKRINDSEKPALAGLTEFASLVSSYGKLKDGVAYAEKALSLYPTSSEAHMLLARLLIGPGQQERRYELLRKAVELDSNNPKTHHQLGWFYIEA